MMGRMTFGRRAAKTLLDQSLSDFERQAGGTEPLKWISRIRPKRVDQRVSGRQFRGNLMMIRHDDIQAYGICQRNLLMRRCAAVRCDQEAPPLLRNPPDRVSV